MKALATNYEILKIMYIYVGNQTWALILCSVSNLGQISMSPHLLIFIFKSDYRCYKMLPP